MTLSWVMTFVTRVFEEGIGGSNAVLFVLSPTSVNRPWFKSETSAGVIRRLHDKIRLIPIILKGLSDKGIPLALAYLKFVRVKANDDADTVAKEIANVMYGDAEPNPVIAAAPEWTTQTVTGRLGFADVRDELLFGFACRRLLETNGPLVSVPEMLAFAVEQGLTQDDLSAAIAVFTKHYYIKHPPARGGLLPNAILIKRRPGLELYIRAYEWERYRTAHNETLASILNGRASDLQQLAAIVSEKSLGRVFKVV